MKIASSFPSISRLMRSPNPEEINSILDLFPTAALVVDTQRRRIVAVNTQAMELSAYTRSELSNLPVKKLFATLDWSDLTANKQSEEKPQQLTLVKRNKSTIDVQVNYSEIASGGHWLLISIESISDLQKRQTDSLRQKMLLQKLGLLSSASQMADLNTALQMIIETGRQLTGASEIAIYQADGQNLELNRCVSLGENLPAQLPSQDLIQLHKPQVWSPGKRSHSPLHSHARVEGLAYLATAPIGDPNAAIGLVALADYTSPPADDILDLLNTLAIAAHSTFQHYYQISNLNQALARQLSFRRFAEVAQNFIQDILIVLTVDFRVVRLNLAAEMALGYSNEEAENLSVQDILIGTENMLPAMNMAADGVPTLNEDSIRLYRRSGEAFLARVSTLPVASEDRVEGIIILIQDLSDQEIAQSQAEQLEQHALLGTVTAIFAHEVRNPINNISTGLQLMAYNLPEGDPQLDLINRLQQDCDRLEELMKSVLSFSRSSEYDMEPVDLGLLVSRLMDRLRPRITAANVQYHLKVNENTPLVLGNPRALEQVFSNLFNNAIQAMESTGGILAVKVQEAETTGKRRQALVIVADNGPGIPKENQEKIFTPFFTTKSSGTGLGLAITKRIVTAHKGIILVNSFPGGTVFTVQMPALEQSLDDIE